MNTQIIRGVEVNRPQTTPLKSTVLDHATVVENRSFGLRNNDGLWPSYNCLDTLVPTSICPDPTTSKSFSTAEWTPAFEFAVHGGVQCKAVGLDVADQKAEVERVFRANEGRGVEQALLGNRFVAAGSDDPSLWDGPVDLSASGMTLIGALGALEGYAATVYAGTPTIHMPRAAAIILFGGGALMEEGGKFYTKTGAKVAAGGGYDSEETPTGSYTMYATGEVYVERSEEVSVQTYVIPGDGNGLGSDETGIPDNTVLALAERMFRVAVDCFVAEATGKAW